MIVRNHICRCEMIQLDMFTDYDAPATVMQLAEVKEIALATKISADKVRKSLFARNGELAKMYLDLHSRLEIIEKNICQGKVAI